MNDEELEKTITKWCEDFPKWLEECSERNRRMTEEFRANHQVPKGSAVEKVAWFRRELGNVMKVPFDKWRLEETPEVEIETYMLRGNKLEFEDMPMDLTFVPDAESDIPRLEWGVLTDELKRFAAELRSMGFNIAVLIELISLEDIFAAKKKWPILKRKLVALEIEIRATESKATNENKYSKPMTKAEVQKRLCISPSTYRRRVESGALRVVEINLQKVKVLIEDLES